MSASNADYPRWCTDECRALYERLTKAELWDCCVMLLLTPTKRLVRHDGASDGEQLTIAGMYIATYATTLTDLRRSTP